MSGAVPLWSLAGGQQGKAYSVHTRLTIIGHYLSSTNFWTYDQIGSMVGVSGDYVGSVQ